MATIVCALTLWARLRSSIDDFNLYKSLENRHGEKRTKEGNSRKVKLRPRVNEKVTKRISRNRTENREGCPWLKRPRRIGVIESREFGKIALYLRYKGCLQPNTL